MSGLVTSTETKGVFFVPVEPPTGTKWSLLSRLIALPGTKGPYPPLARLAVGPGTKGTFCPGPNGSRGKWSGTNACSVVVSSS